MNLNYRKNGLFVFTTLLILILSAPAFAQTATGTVDGTIRDSSGAVIPGVEITLTQQGTGQTRTTVSDDQGRFRITNVPAGQYEAAARLTGFATARTTLELDVAGLETLAFTMQVGEVSTILEVTDIAQKVNTEQGTMVNAVQEQQVVDLPLNGRNVFSLALLQPGVTQSRSSGIGGESGINASGNRSRGNNFSLDGVSNNDPITGGATTVSPNPDIVAEFVIQNNNFSAEYGRNNGAVINVVTKSGTNAVHGSAWWFHRNSALDAREVFDPVGEPAALRRHEFGFTIGGPIVSNKTFFFGGIEWEREFRGESSLARFETAALRDLVRQQQPGSLADQMFQAYPGPTPTGRFADVGSPNTLLGTSGPLDGILDTGEASFSADELFTRYAYNIRVDHEISDSNKIFGRWIGDKQDSPGNGPRGPDHVSNGDSFFGNAIISDTHIFSPTIVNEFRFGYNRNRGDFLVDRTDIPDMNMFASGNANISGFGAYGGTPQLFTAEEYHLVDVVSINKGSHGIKTGFEYRWNQDDSDFQFLTRGYIGYLGVFDFVGNTPYEVTNRVDPNQGAVLPIVGTPRNFRAKEFAFFVQDDWKVTDRLTLNLGVRYDNYGQIGENQGRLANLILGAGENVYERMSNSVVGRVNSDGIFGKDNNNFSPRIGFAYDLTGDGKTSLRGGYGVAYDRLFLNVTGNIRFNPPDSANLGLYPYQLGSLGSAQDVSELVAQQVQVPYPNPLAIPGVSGAGFNAGGTPLLNVEFQGNTTQLSPGGSLRSPDPSLRTSYSMNWFLGIQRELPFDMVMEVNYAGNGGRKLGFIEQYNRYSGSRFGAAHPYPNGTGANGGNAIRINQYWTSENLRTNSINSSHNGGSLSVTKRFSDGLSFQSAFTFGKTMDFNSDNFGSNAGGIFTPDPMRVDLEYGRAGFHIAKRWVSNFIYEIPFMRDQQGVKGALLGGWQLQSILTFQDGTPTTPRARSSSQDYNGDFRSHDRLDAPTGGIDRFQNPGKQAYIDGVFSRSDFNPNGLPGDCDGDGSLGCGAGGNYSGLGTLGRSTFFQHGYNNVDFSLFKNFRTPWFGQEDARIQFRAEFFNLFNRVSLNALQESFTSGSFGRSTSASDAREVQFALKFIF